MASHREGIVVQQTARAYQQEAQWGFNTRGDIMQQCSISRSCYSLSHVDDVTRVEEPWYPPVRVKTTEEKFFIISGFRCLEFAMGIKILCTEQS